jgi:Short-chain alcohol dehydrogenase of unknown specificity
MKERVAVVAGASSGLGRAVALALRGEGYRVVAGARSFSCAENALGEGITCLALDVTDENNVSAFYEKAFALEKQVDVLVNCAAFLVMGACEDIAAAEYRSVLETNFIGMTRMVQGILPHFRKNRAGRILNLSSINGLLGVPFQSAYTAAKHAVEGFSECLAMEVKPFGIEVMLIEPGDHRGGGNKYRVTAEKNVAAYEEKRNNTIKAIEHDEKNGLQPERFGKKIARVLNRKKLPFRFVVADPIQCGVTILHEFFPTKLTMWILTKYYMR